MSATKDLIVEKGATFTLSLVWSTKDVNNVKTPVNLTGYTARSQFREAYDSATHVASMTTENGGIVLGGSQGTITLTLSANATSDITIDKGVWDLELVSGTTVTRLLEGKVTFKPEVTK